MLCIQQYQNILVLCLVYTGAVTVTGITRNDVCPGSNVDSELCLSILSSGMPVCIHCQDVNGLDFTSHQGIAGPFHLEPV